MQAIVFTASETCAMDTVADPTCAPDEVVVQVVVTAVFVTLSIVRYMPKNRRHER